MFESVFMFVDAELNFSFFVLLGNDEFAVTRQEKELILYKIFLNKEITDWQKYGRNTLGEGRVVGGYWSQMTIRISAAPIPEGWNVPH